LRDIPGLKIYLISLVLPCVTVAIPILSTSGFHAFFQQDILFAFFRKMLFVFAITVPFDIRDMDHDQKNNLKTIPLLVGDAKAKGIAVFALITYILLLFIQLFTSSGLDTRYFAALLLSAVISMFIIWQTNKIKNEYFYSLLLEGTMIIQCLLIIGASCF